MRTKETKPKQTKKAVPVTVVQARYILKCKMQTCKCVPHQKKVYASGVKLIHFGSP